MVVDQKTQFSKLLEKSNIDEYNGPKIGKRHIQVVLVFLIVFNNYVMRSSLSVLVVAMTDSNVTLNKDIPTYNWTDKSLIMTSFMWGYMIPQIGAGYVATVFGAKWCLVGSVFFSSISGFFIPMIAATMGSKGVMVLRIVQGISQGFMFPSVHAFLAKWVPLQERSRLGTIPYLGPTLGIILSMLLTGVIASSSLGWPTALYIYGCMGIITAVIFAYFCANEPDLHSTISEAEKSYIKNNLSENGGQSNTNIPVPWYEIFTSLPFWALIICQTGFSWGNWILLFETPIYMNNVMKFDLKSNSVLSSLPYAAEASISLLYGCIADYLIVKKICTISTTRKIMNAWSIILPSIFLCLIANCSSDDPYKAVIYLVFIGFACGSTKSGFNVNQIDLSPNFAGILMGICNGISAAVGSLGPLVVHIFVKNESDPNEWKVVFYIAAVIACISLIFNIFFGAGSVQPWNEGSKKYREKWQALPLKA